MSNNANSNAAKKASTAGTSGTSGTTGGGTKSRSKEYRGKVLPELVGKSAFLCECCLLRKPMSMLDIHHIDPQLGGENHDRENLAILDSGCHDAIHRIAQNLAGMSKDKRTTAQLVTEFAKEINPTRQEEVVHALTTFVVKVASAISLKKNKQIAGGDVDTVISLPPEINALFKQTGRLIKGGDGKPLGKERLTMLALCNLIVKTLPESSAIVQPFISKELLRLPTTIERTQDFNQNFASTRF